MRRPMVQRLLVLSPLLSLLLAGCQSSHADTAQPLSDGGARPDTSSARDGTVAPSPDADFQKPDTSAPPLDAACAGFDIPFPDLLAHNTSAYPAYDRSNFSQNFGDATCVARGGDACAATLAVDPTKVDHSLNPTTPGHVSATNVHSLVASRPDLRWFAHITPSFVADGGVADSGRLDIGVSSDTAAYVEAMISDMVRRGFDGLIVDWQGKGSIEDRVTQRVKTYLNSETSTAGHFTFIVQADHGIPHLTATAADGGGESLEEDIHYFQKEYFGDPHYEKENGLPILMFFAVDQPPPLGLGPQAMAEVKALTEGDGGEPMVWVTQNADTLAESWVDQCFEWTDDYSKGVPDADPYNLAAVRAFYSADGGVASPDYRSDGGVQKKAFGAMVAGFNGTLTKTVNWSLGKYLPRGSGACLMSRANLINSVIPQNVTRMQWATWSDWAEGTEVESGVENDVVVTASLQGSTLSWTYTSGTGDGSTLEHFEIYASPDGTSAVDLGPLPVTATSFDLATAPCLSPGVTYSVEVVAVGQACIRDHASGLISYPR